MHELTNHELQEVSGGFTSLVGMVAGYNQFNLSGTLVYGVVPFLAYSVYKIDSIAPEPGLVMGAVAIGTAISAYNLFLGYCAGTGMAYLLGRLEN